MLPFYYFLFPLIHIDQKPGEGDEWEWVMRNWFGFGFGRPNHNLGVFFFLHFSTHLSLSLSLSLSKDKRPKKKKKVYKNNFPKIKIYTQLSSYNSKITLSLFKKFYLFHIFAFQNTSYQIIYFILYFIKRLIFKFFFSLSWHTTIIHFLPLSKLHKNGIRKRRINSDSINYTVIVATMYFYTTLQSLIWVDFGIGTLPPSIGMIKGKT